MIALCDVLIWSCPSELEWISACPEIKLGSVGRARQEQEERMAQAAISDLLGCIKKTSFHFECHLFHDLRML